MSLINLIALQTILFLLRASDPDEFFKSLDIFGKIAIAGIFKLKIFLISFLRLSKEYLKRPGISGIGSFLSIPSTINIG